MAYLVDKPEDYEARAATLDDEAERLQRLAELKTLRPEANLLELQAADKRRAAVKLRERAADLRKRRTDGVKFG
jgi:hypothetical protein